MHIVREWSPSWLSLRKIPISSTEEGYGTEDIDIIDTEVELEEDPDIRTEEGYGNIDPNLD